MTKNKFFTIYFQRTITLLSLICLMFASGCSHSFDENVATHIEKTCTNFDSPQGCIIDLQDVTDFEWDRVYIFAGLTTVEDIYDAVGFNFKCKHVPDNYIRLIFIKGNQVIKQEQYHSAGGKVQFREYDKKDGAFIYYTKDLSKFYVLRKSKLLVDEDFYDLYPLSEAEDSNQ